MTRDGLNEQFLALRTRTLAVITNTPQPNAWLMKLAIYRNTYMDYLRQNSRESMRELVDIGDSIGNEVGLNVLEGIFFNMSLSKHISLEQIFVATSGVAEKDKPTLRRSLHAADNDLEDHTRALAQRCIDAFVTLGRDRGLTEQWFESMERAGAHTATAFLSENPDVNGDTIFTIVSRIKEMRDLMNIPDLELQTDILAVAQFIFAPPQAEQQ